MTINKGSTVYTKPDCCMSKSDSLNSGQFISDLLSHLKLVVDTYCTSSEKHGRTFHQRVDVPDSDRSEAGELTEG